MAMKNRQNRFLTLSSPLLIVSESILKKNIKIDGKWTLEWLRRFSSPQCSFLYILIDFPPFLTLSNWRKKWAKEQKYVNNLILCYFQKSDEFWGLVVLIIHVCTQDSVSTNPDVIRVDVSGPPKRRNRRFLKNDTKSNYWYILMLFVPLLIFRFNCAETILSDTIFTKGRPFSSHFQQGRFSAQFVNGIFILGDRKWLTFCRLAALL